MEKPLNMEKFLEMAMRIFYDKNRSRDLSGNNVWDVKFMRIHPIKLSVPLTLALIISLFVKADAKGAPSSLGETTTNSAANNSINWWSDARFGMFIHWGLY